MSSKDSDLSQSTEEDTGLFIVQTTMTVTNLLNALRMDGYIVTQVVDGATSIPSLVVEYAPQRTMESEGKRTLLSSLETLQMRGWDLSRLNPTSKESLLLFLGNLVGRSTQEVEDTLQEFSSRILTLNEIESPSSRLGMVTVQDDGSLSVEGYPQYATDSNAYPDARDFCWQPRVAETQPSSDGQDAQPSLYQVRQAARYYNEWEPTVINMDSF